MINFIEVVTCTFEKSCKEKFTVRAIKKHIVEVAFKKFTIGLYYNAYEYDLGFDYYRNRRFFKIVHLDLNLVLQDLGCSNDRLPIYKFMSNEEVMGNYLIEYISLIKLYFKELSKYKGFKINGKKV